MGLCHQLNLLKLKFLIFNLRTKSEAVKNNAWAFENKIYDFLTPTHFQLTGSDIVRRQKIQKFEIF